MTRTISTILVLALAAFALACDSGSKSSKSEPEAEPAPAKAPAPAAEPAPPAPEPEPEPAEPEPSTPEEIELARKAALMEGRDKDAVKYCEMAGIEAGKSDPQALLGCALAACRGKQVEKAQAWAKTLPKDLMKQAKQICRANGVGL